VSSFIQDLQYGIRSLAKNPGFAAVAVLTLALGVGANTAIFSVLRAVVLRDLPYHDPDRIAVLWTKNIRQNLPDGSSYLNFRDWKERSREFEAMAAYIRPEFTRGTLTDGSGAERIYLAEVGPGFFELLGTAPLLGRTFEAADFSATPRAVVISHSLWQQRFAADRSVLGRTVRLDNATVEVVGVSTLSTFLYETNPVDPLIYSAVTLLLLAVTTMACLAPASRAARFDPMAALRRD
jgi:ABC-type antimicrobial peptide transport system permease subunit